MGDSAALAAFNSLVPAESSERGVVGFKAIARYQHFNNGGKTVRIAEPAGYHGCSSASACVFRV